MTVSLDVAANPGIQATAEFKDGQHLKPIFRPEDVVLSKNQEGLRSDTCLSSAVVEETSFVGAFERCGYELIMVSATCEPGDMSYLLTTEAPERPIAKPILAT